MKPYSNDLRSKILQAYRNGEGSLRDIAQRFSVSLNCVWLLWQRYRATGSIHPKPHGGGQPSVMTEERLSILRELVEQHNDATLRELRDAFQQRTGLPVSRGTLSRALKRLKITRKKKTFHATERDQKPEVAAERQAFLMNQPQRPAQRFVFMDESGINLGLARTYGRAPSGQRAVGHRPFNPGSNITLLGALSEQGIIAPLMFPGSLDGELFKVYVEQVLAPQLAPGDTVFLDNLSVHKVHGIEDILADAGIKLEFLPRYSPDLSPLEFAWAKVKEELRRVGARHYESLVEAVGQALDKISSKDVHHWFKHCGYCIEAGGAPL